MNVLQVNFLDTMGGAARIAWDLFRGYQERGHESYLAVGRKSSNEKNVIEIPNDQMRNPWSGLWRSTERRLVEKRIRLLPGAARFLANLGESRRWREQSAGIEDFNFPGSFRLLGLPPQQPDILHFHVLHGGYFDLRSLPALSSRVPTVVTHHDEWMMTGHCACTLGCERWRSGCGQCPDLSIYPAIRRDATAANWLRKREIYQKSRLNIVTPCQWLMDRLQGSVVQDAIVDARVIPNGVDLTIFSPGDQKAARQELGLDEDVWINLFVGHGVANNRFKDFDTLLATMVQFGERPQQRKQLLLCVGEQGEDRQVGENIIRFVKYQTDLHKVAAFYRAADVYVHATRADTFPTSILEAMACGTPVIATAVGGIPEQIEDGVTGFLVPPGGISRIVGCLERLQEDEQLHIAMRAAAAEFAVQKFSLEAMIENYLSWYRKVLEREV